MNCGVFIQTQKGSSNTAPHPTHPIQSWSVLTWSLGYLPCEIRFSLSSSSSRGVTLKPSHHFCHPRSISSKAGSGRDTPRYRKPNFLNACPSWQYSREPTNDVWSRKQKKGSGRPKRKEHCKVHRNSQWESIAVNCSVLEIILLTAQHVIGWVLD